MDFLKEFQHLQIHLEEIELATGNFSNVNLIGNGGFGKVYKGELCHSKGCSMVAFKRLEDTHGQGNSEFWKEITTLSRYVHENLISLLGFCDKNGEKILVYEYASRKSLDLYLSDTTLTWTQRLKICLAVAKGLHYLHDPKGTQQRILHRDIKSSNILLDVNWNAKLSDFGLSKLGVATPQHSVVVTNVAGTIGYLDPLYMKTGCLMKESDVYSFGVVLFEVLCGRLCYRIIDGQPKIFVRMWIDIYKEKKLENIIFPDLIQQMDSRSLETFSDIAYRCLQKSREERPTMAHVVDELQIALAFQENYEEVNQQLAYEDMIKTMVYPPIYRSKVELNMHLSKGVLLNHGKTWFSINESGEHCEMISAKECLISTEIQFHHKIFTSEENSRFAQGNYNSFGGKFKTCVTSQFLTPRLTYTVNLVFKLIKRIASIKQTYVGLQYKLEGDTQSSIAYLADVREDGWLTAELYQFTSHGRNTDLTILFEGLLRYDCNIVVQGIEFRPLEKMKRDVLANENVVLQPISDMDIDWQQKLPSDYEDIIKLAKDSVQWTKKKELYFILRKGFLINNGEEWFSLTKNGKKCYMLPARAALLEQGWERESLPDIEQGWERESLPDSRFGEATLVTDWAKLSIECKIKTQLLSPRTTYASYLVYKIAKKNHKEFDMPLKVKDKIFQFDWEEEDFWSIYLLSPQTPVIGGKIHNIHAPLNRPKMKGLPQLRNDGWMEVQVWNFRTDIASTLISLCINVSRFKSRGLFKELIVQGIEFKPI